MGIRCGVSVLHVCFRQAKRSCYAHLCVLVKKRKIRKEEGKKKKAEADTLGDHVPVLRIAFDGREVAVQLKVVLGDRVFALLRLGVAALLQQ